MNEEMEDMFICIYNNELPIIWRLLTPETCKNLPNWISHLLQRVDEYKKWVCSGMYGISWKKKFLNLNV